MPNISSSSAAQASWSSVKSRTISLGVDPESVTSSTGATQRGAQMSPISVSTARRARRLLPPARRRARSASLGAGLARVWSKPCDWRRWNSSEWVTTTRRSRPKIFWWLSNAATPGTSSSIGAWSERGTARRSRCWEVGTEPTKCRPGSATKARLSDESIPASKTTLSSRLLELASQGTQGGLELGDVGSVARIGVAGDRDRSVTCHDEGEPDDA